MTPTVLKTPGVYLLRPPSFTHCEIKNELFILFCVKYPKLQGAVLYDPQGSQDIADLMDRCLQQLQELDIPSSKIQLKICGGARIPVAALARLNKWIRSRGISVVAADIGRFVKRQIEIRSERGELGILALHTPPPPAEETTDSLPHLQRGRRASP